MVTERAGGGFCRKQGRGKGSGSQGHGGAVDLRGEEAAAMTTESRVYNRFSRQEPFTEDEGEGVSAPG